MEPVVELLTVVGTANHEVIFKNRLYSCSIGSLITGRIATDHVLAFSVLCHIEVSVSCVINICCSL